MAAHSEDSSIGVRTVAGLAWPIMISTLSYTAMSVTDTVYVARLGTVPLAGLGLGVILSFLIQSFGIGLLGGAKVAIAQRTGASAHDRARALAWQGIWLAVCLGILVAPASFLQVGFFRAFGADPLVASQAHAFFAVRISGAGLMFGITAISGWFQGRGDTRTPMVATLLANLLNVFLDPLFIFGLLSAPRLGIAGAALATLLGQAAGLALLIIRARASLRAGERRLQPALLGEIWRLGAPIGFRQVLGMGSFAALSALLASAGTAELAAHILAIRLISVSFMPGYAISDAVGVLVGQAVGAGRPVQAREALRAGRGLGMAVMAVFGVVFLLQPDPLVAIFGAGEEVAPIARQLLAVAAFFQVLDAVAMVGLGALNGAGDTRFAMAATVLPAWGITVPLTWLAVRLGGGAVGGWLALTVEIAVLAGLVLYRTSGDAWLHRRLEPEADSSEVIAAI